MGTMTEAEAIERAKRAFVDYYNGRITVNRCYDIILDPDVRSKLSGWKAPDPWDVLGRSGEVTEDSMRPKPQGERRAIRKRKAEVRKRFVPYKV